MASCAPTTSPGAAAAPARARLARGRTRRRAARAAAAAALRSETLRREGCGSTAEVYTFGGCVTSWKPGGGADRLYVRPDAKFDGSKPISGGIPHCWPQFGPSDVMQQVRRGPAAHAAPGRRSCV